MAKAIALLPIANQDLDSAYYWYERQKIGLGKRFLTAINASFQSIQKTPAGYQIIHKDYRRAVLRRFPYAIFYEEQEDQIVIYAVLHTARNPEDWQERLR